MTILANKILTGAATAAPSPVPRPLTRVLSAGRRGELVTLPHVGPAWLELPGAIAWEEVQTAVRAELKAAGLELDIATAEVFELKVARHTLARAARDPDNHANPLGTIGDWGEIDPDILNACWQAFGDVRERLDSLSAPLTNEERAAIDIALKKKDARLLRSFGIAKLSAWLVSTADLQPSSPSPSSSNTESSSGG